jgi:hypothetical protein
MFYICSGSNTDDESIRPNCYNNNIAFLIMRVRARPYLTMPSLEEVTSKASRQSSKFVHDIFNSQRFRNVSSCSHASNVGDENQSSCIVDRNRFSTIRTRLRQRSAEQVLTATDERTLYIFVCVG